jgi:hypothetical protein
MARPTDPAYYAPTPGPVTVFFRTFVPWQLIRFAWINLKMLRMISIGHHGRAPLRPIALVDDGAPPRPPGAPRP